MGKNLDYRNRPAKNIERHLIAEACRRLVGTNPSAYQYVGMGALEFVDFQIMHRQVGIQDMFSIEASGSARYEYNKPFRSIEIVPERSSSALKKLDLSRKTIMWLDYMGPLTSEEMGDTAQAMRTLPVGSFFIVTLRAKQEIEGERVERFTKAVGSDYVPEGVRTENDLVGWDVARAQRTAFDMLVNEAVNQRAEEVAWRQILNFHYNDMTPMQTIGGLIVAADEDPDATLAAFQGLDFIRTANDEFDLRVPVITARERSVLDAQLPTDGTPLALTGISAKDLEAYERIYKYMPLAGHLSPVEYAQPA